MVAKEIYDNNNKQQITWIIPLLMKDDNLRDHLDNTVIITSKSDIATG